MERGLCDGNRKSSFLLQAVQRDVSPDSRLSLQIHMNVRYLAFITVCVCVRARECAHNQVCFLNSPPSVYTVMACLWTVRVPPWL